MLVIVPNYVSDAINAAIDKALLDLPEAEKDREHFYDVLLAHFNDHGVIPEFTLHKRDPPRVPASPRMNAI
jgi:hypothetical protein